MLKFGLLGRNIDYSLSPKLHKLFFQSIDLDGEYTLFDSKNEPDEEEFIKKLLDEIREKKISGINVTIPYKEKIIGSLDELDREAEEIGAVNTVTLENGVLKGYNTDYIGILETIKKMEIELAGERVYILGAGGTAKTIIKAVMKLGGAPIIVSRKIENLDLDMKSRACIISYEELRDVEKGKLLINTTPLGNKNNLGISPLEEEEVKKFENVLDLNYNPLITQIMRYSNRAENGLFMLVTQGIASEIIWNKDRLEIEKLNYKKISEKIYRKLEEELENNG